MWRSAPPSSGSALMATSANKPIGVVIPTRWEAAPVLKAFAFKRIGSRLYRSTTANLLLVISGMGKERARQAAFQLCENGAGELISAGFCGALVPELKVGDLLTHRIATVDKAVITKAERQALSQRAGAQGVDMETQAVIEAGTRRGVPIRVLRVVSDTWDDDLSPLLGPGDLSPWKIALRLLHPGTWPIAARLYRQSNQAKRRLVQAFSEHVLAGTDL